MKRHVLLVLGGCAMMCFAAHAAALDLAPIFNHHMVLQRDKPIAVWGHADPGENVTLQLASSRQSVITDADGRWLMHLAPQSAGGPFSLIADGADGKQVRLDDILIGDVWLSSGQSNMEFLMRDSQGGADEVAHANYPNIRFFNLEKHASQTPIEEVKGAYGVVGWHAAVGDDANALKLFSAVAYHFGKKLHQQTGVPIGLINSAWGGTAIEPWTPSWAFESPPAPKHPGQDDPENASNLYNGMIAPLAPMSLKGFTWYQGESNLTDGLAYAGKLTRLITSWRRIFGEELGFYFVQLAPFNYGEPSEGYLPLIWEAQSNVSAQVPHTGMAVISDVGNLSDIHPRDKTTVGERLALWALAKDYGRLDIMYSGPVFRQLHHEGDALVLDFDTAGSALASRDGMPLNFFTVAGTDGIFKPASSVQIRGTSLVIRCDSIAQPLAVRFAWTQLATPNLVNSAGLPASAFRTDRPQLEVQ